MGGDLNTITALWKRCQSTPLSFEIPGLPPSVNQLYATFKGRRIKTRIGHRWEGFSLLFVRKAATETYGTFKLESLKGRPLAIEFIFCRPTWRAKSGSGLLVRPDLDNHLKSGIDGVTSALGLDDSAVVELLASKAEDNGPERTVVRLTFLEEID